MSHPFRLADGQTCMSLLQVYIWLNTFDKAVLNPSRQGCKVPSASNMSSVGLRYMWWLFVPEVGLEA
jgi:hypothetical protein